MTLPSRPRFGLVTYLWGKDLPLPELLATCEAAGVGGVELRTEHAHGVEPSLSARARSEVRDRFMQSGVVLVGYGSNARFHEEDSSRVRENIRQATEYIRLMHDCGGSGVKVKPDALPSGSDEGKVIERIGRALNELGQIGDDFGQEIRLECHGRGTSDPEILRRIMEVADHPNVGLCWNCNGDDLKAPGLDANFHKLRPRFGATLHTRVLEDPAYPYPELFRYLVETHYSGWVLLEAGGTPEDLIGALKQQVKQFEQLLTPAE